MEIGPFLAREAMALWTWLLVQHDGEMSVGWFRFFISSTSSNASALVSSVSGWEACSFAVNVMTWPLQDSCCMVMSDEQS